MNTIIGLMTGLQNSLLTGPQYLLDDYKKIDKTAGVYCLYHDRTLVYIGKAKTDLRARMSIHYRKLKASKIDLSEMTFSTMPACEYLSLGAEQYMIDTIKPKWNFSGFGSNAHGKGRPKQKLSEWVKLYG